MLAFAAALVTAVTVVTCPWSFRLSQWPPDIRETESAGEATHDAAFRTMQHLEVERWRVVTADVIVVGLVVSEEAYHSDLGPVLTAFTIDVDRVLKGDVPQKQIVTSIMGGTIDGITSLRPGVDYPSVGERYVFCLTDDEIWRPGCFRGGSNITRYGVVDGRVVRKGMTLDEFVEYINEQLRVLPAAEQLTMADAAVVARVVEVVNDPYPATVPQDWARLHPNYATLSVLASLRGDVDPGRLLVELPPMLHSGHTIDALSEGSWIVAFLRHSGDEWCLLDGVSSVYTLAAQSEESALDSARALLFGDVDQE